MFSPDMPRAAGLILAGLLSACVAQEPVSVLESAPSHPPPLVQVPPPEISRWLDLQDEVLGMTSEEAETELAGIRDVPEGGNELYHFGLLNQQVKDYNRWIAARDAFRVLRKDRQLDVDQRRLVGILERYNQSRINWYSRQAELLDRYRLLQRELDASDDENLLLEQKIQALTDLEAVISTRKEQ